MTRYIAVAFAVGALALGACERHPLPGQTEVSHTHGSGGAHHEDHPAPVHHEAKAEEKKAEPAPTGVAPGEAPKFFPEKK